MSMNAPPILCKHPMLETLEALAGNDDALLSMIQGIVTGGTAVERLDRIEGEGLFGRYTPPQKNDARQKLLGSWGDETTLRHISDKLGEALQRVRASEPRKTLRGWWAAGATAHGIRCAVEDDAESVYFVLLTPPMGDEVAADKAFDASFRNALQAQAAALKAWTDSFTPHF
jgi:hypothetical protein